LRKKQKAV